MRVLFITSRLPGNFPRGDQRRAYHLIRCLGGRHAITLLSVDDGEARPSDLRALDGLCERIVLVRQGLCGRLARALRAWPTPLPMQTAMYDSRVFADRLQDLLDEGSFDLVHAQLARLGSLVSRVRGTPCVMDFVDALSLNMAGRARFDAWPLGRIAGREASRLAAYERLLCRRLTAATVSADRDRTVIGEFSRLGVVPNGVDLKAFPPRAPDDTGAQGVFVGNLGYFPNVDGLLWFAREVLPPLLVSHPDFVLNLVGSRPAPAIRRLARRQPRLRLIGPVPDVRPWLARAAVAVVPLRAGSGQQLKAIEAMAGGTPLVTTPGVAAGLRAVPGETLLVANDGPEMARRIASLLDDPVLAAGLARRARAFVERRHTWERSAALLEDVWRAALARHGDPVAP